MSETPGVRRRSATEKGARASWGNFYREARRSRKAWRGCEVCEPQNRDPNAWTEVHHVVSQQRIKRLARDEKIPKMRLEELLTDPRNTIVLCKEHHHLHTVKMKPVPLRLIPRGAWEFAREIGLLDEMKGEYIER